MGTGDRGFSLASMGLHWRVSLHESSLIYGHLKAYQNSKTTSINNKKNLLNGPDDVTRIPSFSLPLHVIVAIRYCCLCWVKRPERSFSK